MLFQQIRWKTKVDYSDCVGCCGKAVSVMPIATLHTARGAYSAPVRPWAESRVQRMARHEKPPVYDFLFEYYSFRPAHLLRWTPGFNVEVVGATRDDINWSEFV